MSPGQICLRMHMKVAQNERMNRRYFVFVENDRS
jgi:hypothetical protein